MNRIAYVNGRFVPIAEASVSMEDRGYQFADGVYEVIALYQNCLLDGEGHLARLERSLKELAIPLPMSLAALRVLIGELIRRNRAHNGLIYMQVTRGIAPRNHLSQPKAPVLTMSLNNASYPTAKQLEQGVAVITTPDRRWARCDIKSIALLPNVLARREAQRVGAKEAWQINRDGNVTEGSLSNAYMVKDGAIITHPPGPEILGGITRERVLSLAREAGISITERPFTLEEAYAAAEAFITGASAFVLPVVQIDGRPVATGAPGPVTRQLIRLYGSFIASQPKLR